MVLLPLVRRIPAGLTLVLFPVLLTGFVVAGFLLAIPRLIPLPLMFKFAMSLPIRPAYSLASFTLLLVIMVRPLLPVALSSILLITPFIILVMLATSLVISS